MTERAMTPVTFHPGVMVNEYRSAFHGNAMPTHRMEELLKTFSYKEHFKFRIIHDFGYGDMGRLSCTMIVPDTEAFPGRRHPIPIIFEQSIPPIYSEEEFWRFLRDAIHVMETHEADEWFVVDGQKMFDPHKPRRSP